MRRTCWLAVITAAAMLGAVACNNGGDNTSETPLPVTTVIERTAVIGTPPATPPPVPTITDDRVEYAPKGYTVQIPAGWSVDPNVVVFEDLTSDAFFAPEESGGVQPSIAVSREDVAQDVTPSDYVDKKVEVARGLGAEDLAVTGPVTVSGVEASVIDYGLVRDSTHLQKRDVVFLSRDHGWVIALVTAYGQQAAFQPVLDEFLSSFELLEPKRPDATAG